MNKRFILSVLSNFFDSKNAESIFAPLLVLLVLCCTILSSKAQYLPILEDEPYWTQLAAVCDGEAYLRLELEGDTLVDGLGYQVLIARQCESDFVFGLVRTNASNSKLWFRELNGPSEEHLLMDLDLTVGDVFRDVFGGASTVVAVDQVEGRKVVTLSHLYIGECYIGPEVEPLRFIEGVGPNAGFTSEPTAYILDCSGNAQGLSYQFTGVAWWLPNDCSTPCYRDVGTRESTTSAEQTAFQLHIVGHRITLTTEQEQPCLLAIFDVLGRHISSHPISAFTPAQLPSLTKGYYIAVLLDQNNTHLVSQPFLLLD